MKVTLTTHGGLAAAINLGLPPRVVNTENLPEPAAQELAQLLAAAKAAEPAEVPADAGPRHAPDAMSYTITVDGNGHQVVLTATDTTMSREFGDLLNWLEQHFADA
ncbi:MAG: protealysin inhibitor emfourin [Pseudonocardiaceae bacterium]